MCKTEYQEVFQVTATIFSLDTFYEWLEGRGRGGVGRGIHEEDGFIPW
jgi:hypothetical protein